MPAGKKAAAASVYQLKVTLRGSRPPIWRRIEVPANVTLARLHWILQVAMGWTNSHLHQFIVEDEYYSDPDFELEDTEDERRVRLAELLQAPKDRIVYQYDFGDDWEHDVVLEKVLPAGEGTGYAVCLGGKRAGPPEDVGGIFGYENYFLAAIRDPEHPEHEEILEWAGGVFDPEAFDLEEVNRLLGRVR